MRSEWQPYLSFGHKMLLSKGSNVYYQGQEGTGFYYVEEGRISIQLLSEEGKERIVDYILGGHLLGEVGIYGGAHSTSAVCDTDVVLYYFPIEAFKLILRTHPDAKNIFMKSLSCKIRSLAEIVALTDKPYEKQMAHFLVQLYGKYNGLPVPISPVSLAKCIGTSRITVYKIIQKWSSKGLISQKNQGFEILDIDGIKTLL